MLELIVEHMELKTEQRWRAGEERSTGQPYRTSGFRTMVADCPNPVQMLAKIREFLGTCKSRSTDFLDVHAELTIGITVGDEVQYIAVLDFSHTMLRQLADLGITLSIATYPAGVPE